MINQMLFQLFLRKRTFILLKRLCFFAKLRNNTIGRLTPKIMLPSIYMDSIFFFNFYPSLIESYSKGFSVEPLQLYFKELSITNSGLCKNCGRKKEELLPVFIEGQTSVGKCEYWCKDCLRNRS